MARFLPTCCSLPPSQGKTFKAILNTIREESRQAAPGKFKEALTDAKFAANLADQGHVTNQAAAAQAFQLKNELVLREVYMP